MGQGGANKKFANVDCINEDVCRLIATRMAVSRSWLTSAITRRDLWGLNGRLASSPQPLPGEAANRTSQLYVGDTSLTLRLSPTPGEVVNRRR